MPAGNHPTLGPSTMFGGKWTDDTLDTFLSIPPLPDMVIGNAGTHRTLPSARRAGHRSMLLWMSREPEPLLCGLAGGAQNPRFLKWDGGAE